MQPILIMPAILHVLVSVVIIPIQNAVPADILWLTNLEKMQVYYYLVFLIKGMFYTSSIQALNFYRTNARGSM
jgi:hypothetical protein